VSGEELVIDARIIIEPLQLGGAGDLQKIAVANLVLGQQQQVKRVFVELGVAVGHAARGHVGLEPDDGLHPRVSGGTEELHHAEHRAVVRDGHGAHVQLFDPVDQLLDVAEAVQQGIFGVHVKVGEIRHDPSGLKTASKYESL
jgi:hypothetical protein